MRNEKGDVLLYQTNDDGEINLNNGVVEMSGGLETSAYLSLFGGNEDDNGQKDNPKNWWGNIGETETDKQYRSELQNLLQGLPPTSKNLIRLEAAANRDLAWMITKGVATTITVFASIPGLNKVKLRIMINAENGDEEFEFLENWRDETNGA